MSLGRQMCALAHRTLSRCRATTTTASPAHALLRPASLGGNFGNPTLSNSGARHSPSMLRGSQTSGLFRSGTVCHSPNMLRKACTIGLFNFGALVGPRFGKSFSTLNKPVFGSIGPDGLPVSVNWANLPAVNPIVSQGNFGGCWAFASAAAVEAINAIRTNQLLKLPEQQLIDCVHISCSGYDGYPFESLKYIVDNGGLVSSAVYPYVGGVESPLIGLESEGVTIDSAIRYFDIDEYKLKALVAEHPVIVCIGADKRFREYRQGVLDGPNYTLDEMEFLRIGHCVLVIGYGTWRGVPCWLIRNSWGLVWGMEGYGFLARDTGVAGGAFGMTRYVCYPVKYSPNTKFCTVKRECKGYWSSWWSFWYDLL